MEKQNQPLPNQPAPVVPVQSEPVQAAGRDWKFWAAFVVLPVVLLIEGINVPNRTTGKKILAVLLSLWILSMWFGGVGEVVEVIQKIAGF